MCPLLQPSLVPLFASSVCTYSFSDPPSLPPPVCFLKSVCLSHLCTYIPDYMGERLRGLTFEKEWEHLFPKSFTGESNIRKLNPSGRTDRRRETVTRLLSLQPLIRNWKCPAWVLHCCDVTFIQTQAQKRSRYGCICWRFSYLQTTRRVVHFEHYDLIFHIWNSWFASLSGTECFTPDLGKLWRIFDPWHHSSPFYPDQCIRKISSQNS